MLFQRTNCFHQSTFKVIANTHNFSGRFHLCGQSTFCCNKLIKWKSWYLNNTVIQHRFKTCICLSGNCIFNLIQCIPKCYLCCNLCNRISGCLRSQSRRAAYTWIYLDNTIFKGIRIKRILHITSTGNIKFRNNIEC